MPAQPDYEAQLSAMRVVMEALTPLDESGRTAVLGWVNSQLGIRADASPKSTPDSSSMRNPSTREGTVSVVAQKIGAKSARDLLLAASAHLTLYQGKDTFSKDDLVTCAKEARSWKANYSNQMAVNIKRMSDAGTLFEKAKDIFGLSDSALADLEQRLAQ